MPSNRCPVAMTGAGFLGSSTRGSLKGERTAPTMGAMVKVDIQGALRWLQLDRPNKAHAYDRDMLEQLDAGLGGRVMVVSSTGERAFCGGADLDQMAHVRPLDALELYSQAVFDRLARHTAVSICAVQGAAVAGGCELALACDVRIAGPRARFSLPEVSLGLVPSAGGSTRLPAVVGPARAKEIILLGRSVDAETALAWGLVNEIHEDPVERALELGRSLLERDAVALRLAKQILVEPSLEKERIAEALLYQRRKKE